jgi:ketosteroid isomerase-like protein
MPAVVAELSELQARQRQAHLDGDAMALTAMFADDFVSVQDGEISRPSREDSRERFERYFALVRFIAWDDLREPVIEVSADGTLATVLVHKLVHLTFQGADGTLQEEITTFAWVEAWRHAGGRWELALVVSTRKNASPRPADPAQAADHDVSG